MPIYPTLEDTIQHFPQPLRRSALLQLSGLITAAVEHEEPININFICTHNSRRSQIAQIWAMVAAARSGNKHVKAFSGGTEVTALHPNVVKTLSALGFRISQTSGENPRFNISFSNDHPPIECWSKRYDDPANPTTNFVSVMVCNDADANCPLIPNSTERISLPYKDPKVSDGTGEEELIYRRTAQEIGSEIFSLF